MSILEPACFIFASSQRIRSYFSRHADTQFFCTNLMFFYKDLPQPILYIAFRQKSEEFIEMANCILSGCKVLV